MIHPSTVSICRDYLAKEIQLINEHLSDLKRAKTKIATPIPNKKQREIYLFVEAEERKFKARRKKVEAAIRDLKECVWTGNPRSLPCGAII